ncbi:MAG: hypothetical protein ABIH55_02245, partial [Nanoarchaeota archaeon]
NIMASLKGQLTISEALVSVFVLIFAIVIIIVSIQVPLNAAKGPLWENANEESETVRNLFTSSSSEMKAKLTVNVAVEEIYLVNRNWLPDIITSTSSGGVKCSETEYSDMYIIMVPCDEEDATLMDYVNKPVEEAKKYMQKKLGSGSFICKAIGCSACSFSEDCNCMFKIEGNLGKNIIQGDCKNSQKYCIEFSSEPVLDEEDNVLYYEVLSKEKGDCQ